MNKNILVIGACNIDIQGTCAYSFVACDSNIGSVSVGYGGVGRNIADNLNKLIPHIKMITILGNDEHSKSIKKDLEDKGIDISDSLICEGKMSTYLSILDENREMIAAISDMEILKHLNLDFLKTKISVIEKADIVVLDANLSIETLTYLSKIKKDNQVFVFDTVSTKKAKNVLPILDSIDILKTNTLEIKAITDIEDKELASEFLINNGVKMLFLTMGANGVKYYSKESNGYLQNPRVEVVDVTGAGDIFTSALVYAYSKGYDIKEMTKIAQCASIIKIGQNGTVPNNFSEKILLDEYIKRYRNV